MTTGKMTSIARPYAIAAFEFALEKNALSAWQAMLDSAAALTENSMTQQLLKSPSVSSDQLSQLYCDVLKKTLDPEQTNFIRLVSENERLEILPDVADLFREYRQAQEKTLTVNVYSAVPLAEPYQQKLSEVLKNRLQRQVDLQCKVEPDLLGGAVIVAGDMVIDGSVRGKLNRMIEFIS